MKLSFRIIYKIALILAILIGCATTEEIKETDSAVLLNQGTAYAKKGQYDQAIAYLTKSLEINPRYADAYYNRGIAYAQGKGQFDKAISDFTKAIEENPNYADAYKNRGFVYMVKLRNKKKACSDWKRACELGSCKYYEQAKRNGDCK